jgi:hypothetical protein
MMYLLAFWYEVKVKENVSVVSITIVGRMLNIVKLTVAEVKKGEFSLSDSYCQPQCYYRMQNKSQYCLPACPL